MLHVWWRELQRQAVTIDVSEVYEVHQRPPHISGLHLAVFVIVVLEHVEVVVQLQHLLGVTMDQDKASASIDPSIRVSIIIGVRILARIVR